VIRGVGLAVTDGYFATFYHEDEDFLGFRSTRAAAETAYRQAGITDPRAQLDLVECHDCFTVTELVNYEDLGLCGRGEGAALLESGATTHGGDIPVNVSGGLQSCGHPVGATGVRMIAELTDHVTGRAGERQVEGARLGAAHTLGGPGMVSTVCVVGAAD
jgi:acetyl-CoA C-acetyltransferase